MALSKTVSGAAFDSGYADNPDHKLTVEPAGARLAVDAGGRRLFETADALVLREADYLPVYYFPRETADMTALRPTDRTSWCPFKGRASYFSIGEDPALENAVWSYEDPFEEVGAIKDHLAFYPDRVSIAVLDD